MLVFLVPIIHVASETLGFIVGWMVSWVFQISCCAFVGWFFGQGLPDLTNYACIFKDKKVVAR